MLHHSPHPPPSPSGTIFFFNFFTTSPCISLVFCYSATLQFLGCIFLSCQPIILQSSWNIFLSLVLSPNLVSFTNWTALVSPPCSRPLAELLSSCPLSWHMLFHTALFVAVFPAHLHTLHVQGVWCGPCDPGSHLSAVQWMLACTSHQVLTCTCCTVPAREVASRGPGWQDSLSGIAWNTTGCFYITQYEEMNITTDSATPNLLLLQLTDSNRGCLPRGETFSFQRVTSDTTVL